MLCSDIYAIVSFVHVQYEVRTETNVQGKITLIQYKLESLLNPNPDNGAVYDFRNFEHV